jgi:hypothetical protein
MARPKPSVITEHTDRKSYKTTQILESEGTWVVVFDKKPINIRDLDHSSTLVKYRKSSFSNRGAALNLCKKLSAQFNSDKFSVIFLKADNGTT